MEENKQETIIQNDREFFSKLELANLLEKVTKKLTVGQNGRIIMAKCQYMYRNADRKVFDDIMAANVMEKRPMNVAEFASEKSPARALIMPEGLFFCATVRRMFDNRFGLPNISPYGDTRLVAPIGALLEADNTNLYFLDTGFVPYGAYNGFVIIMATKNGSPADAFGRKHLLPLETVSGEHVRDDDNHKTPLRKRLRSVSGESTPGADQAHAPRSKVQRKLFDDDVGSCDDVITTDCNEDDQETEVKHVNPFFVYNQAQKTWKVCATGNVWVEVFYTHSSINLSAKWLAANGCKIYNIDTNNVLRP